MSGTRNGTGMESPMEMVFSWSATPSTGQSNGAGKIKRKCDDDSGYVTPCSAYKSNCDSGLETSDSRNDTGFVSVDAEDICTPYIKSQDLCSKKRLIACSSRGPPKISDCTFTSPVGDDESYTEFLYGETSLYNEHLGGKSALEEIPEERNAQGGLGLFEDTKKIEVDVGVEEMEVDYSPTTPSSTTCPERLLKKPPLRKQMSEPRLRQAGRKRQTHRSRSLVGFEKLDILYQLGGKLNQSLVVSRILGYLSDSDISNVTMVSRTWKNLCLGDQRTRNRWLDFVSERKERKENLCVFQSSKLKSSLTPLLDRNHSTPLKTQQPTSPPVSPSKVRFHLFQKEAKKLKNGEILMQCPRCSLPSVCTPTRKLGECVRANCGMRFCTICLRAYHENRPCDGYFTPTNTTPTKRRTTIGSKESRKNLRRL